MPFVTAYTSIYYGTYAGSRSPNTYCVHDTSRSDYGKCYGVEISKAYFVQTDTSTYPTLPCETDGTCTRFTSTAGTRTLSTIFNYTGKQAIFQLFYTRSHSPQGFQYNIGQVVLVPVPSPFGAIWFTGSHNYELNMWPIYEPVYNYKAYLNPYTISVGNVSIIRWSGNMFTSSLQLIVVESSLNNVWYAGVTTVMWAYESSPLAIIPLDYDREYLPYQELRSVFGYAATGVDQPGWNADDIIGVLRELFPNRAWAVFDDKTYTLFLYNLTPDYVPDWLIEKLNPIAMKILMSPSDSSIAKAWLDELSRRNAYNTPLPEMP
jgi:hypothetical protein